MKRSYRFWIVGLILAAGMLVAVACNGDDDGDDGNGGTTTGATEPPDTVDVPGVSDTEVILGTHTSLTGPIAAYSIIPTFTLAYFDYINATEGGVAGRTITYKVTDDAYEPAKAVDLTRQLVEQDKIFALFNALGTPNHLQVIDYLQERGVPDMYLATGAIEWVKDPSARPLVFGSNPNYTGEGLVLGKYIADNFAGGKVGIILQNDDFGIDGAAGVEIGVGDALEIVGQLPYEVTDPDLFSQIDSLRAADADVVVLFSTPLLLANAIKHARNDLDWDVPFVITAVSMNELTGLIAGGDVIEGTVGPVATYMGYHSDRPAIATHIEILDTIGFGPEAASVLSLYAQFVAELMVETLERAGEDLTRESLVAAAESIQDWLCSVCLFPVTLGPDDHDPSQTVAIATFDSNGKILISDLAYSWEGISVADLSVDSLVQVDVPADALATP
ncbi:MAG: ABC transporter substrate-binding protein [Chloroflexi bacterium]|nr:ABC transporter substrate-binding protein [Chloroflexota bacterium]